MTQDKTPSDAEIEALAEEHLDAVQQFGRLWIEGQAEFARAVLAKWGSPVVAGEPIGWAHAGSVLALQKGAHVAYIYARQQPGASQPVYTTPRPTQAQAGAVPLTEQQLVACIEAAGFKTWDNRMWALKRAIEAAHGIVQKEGGQHAE